MGAVDGDGDGRNGAGAGGLNDRRLGLFEEPTDSFAVGFVAKLTCQLEDPGRTRARDPYPTATPFHLGVPIFIAGG